jgi:membrane-bound lytic murein transglycosylase D
MEKQLQMRLLSIALSLATCLSFLPGCASLEPTPGQPVALGSVSEPKSASPEVADKPIELSPIGKASPTGNAVAHLALPNDLWERIRKGFKIPNLETDLVADRTQWYAAKTDYLQRMGERSSKYLFHIVEELEQRNMPTELALLPFIESAFNPQALSSAKASGIWQFMPATGKSFDLKQNAFRDDRRDVQASTRAALDYLERLYKQFGDWHLALAAYNWGEGNLGKSIARNQRAGLPTGYVDLNMPMETRMYIPKFQAMKNIVGNPSAYKVMLHSVPNHPYFQSVPLRRDMDVTVAAKLAEISVDDFKSLNPSASRPVLLAAGTPSILLPWDKAEVFQRNYESSDIGRMASWTAWITPSNMRPAEAAKRVGMSEADLRAINNIPAKMIIKAGSALLVPRSLRILDDVTARVADNGKLDLSPEAIAKRKKGVKAGKKTKGDGTTKQASKKSTKDKPDVNMVKR